MLYWQARVAHWWYWFFRVSGCLCWLLLSVVHCCRGQRARMAHVHVRLKSVPGVARVQVSSRSYGLGQAGSGQVVPLLRYVLSCTSIGCVNRQANYTISAETPQESKAFLRVCRCRCGMFAI